MEIDQHDGMLQPARLQQVQLMKGRQKVDRKPRRLLEGCDTFGQQTLSQYTVMGKA